jgi:hypothetical protein
MRWYITASVCRGYQRLQGWLVQDDGPSFDRAERELANLADEAHLLHAMGERSDNAAIYRARATIRGRRRAVDLYVTEMPRAEGPLPQLVRIRTK